MNEHSTHEVLIVFASSPLLILYVSTNTVENIAKGRKNNMGEWHSVANVGDTTLERS